jgi:hypothetical protein
LQLLYGSLEPQANVPPEKPLPLPSVAFHLFEPSSGSGKLERSLNKGPASRFRNSVISAFASRVCASFFDCASTFWQSSVHMQFQKKIGFAFIHQNNVAARKAAPPYLLPGITPHLLNPVESA